MPSPHLRRGLALTAGVAVVATGAALAAAPAATAAPSSATVTLQNTLPRWLSHAHKNTVTPFAATSQTVRVYLQPKGGTAALQAAVAAVSDPASASYRHFLTGAQYDATYAPTAASANAVVAYLKSKGLTVSGVAAKNRYVTASGTTNALGAAFGTSLASYTHDGQTVTAPSSAAKLPAVVGNQVLTVTGLDTTKTTKSHDDVTPQAPPPAGFVNGRPCATNYGTPLATYQADFKTKLPKFGGTYLPYAPCGYTGPQFRAAYESGLQDFGKGVTVAITDAYAWQYLTRDANTYAANHGDGTYTDGQLTQVPSPTGYRNQTDCGPSGWAGEQMLDVEAVHAMAPDANVRYFASASCYDDDFLDTLARVVDDGKAKLVTNSWSDLESNESAASVAAYESVFMAGAMQGVTFFFSSGDDGDELDATGVKQVGYPSSDPYVVAAGGTATGISNGTIVNQTGWGTHSYSLAKDGKSWVPGGFLYGAGGGSSSLFNRPSWQNGVVPASFAPGRAVPDIAMDADPNTGMLIGITQKFANSGTHYGEYRIGGTSLASPLLAGFMALAVQQAGGAGFGFVNPTLYAANSKAGITDVLPVNNIDDRGVVRVNYVNSEDPSDGLAYSVRTFDQDSSLPTTTGWDPVTGIGVPNPKFVTSQQPPTS